MARTKSPYIPGALDRVQRALSTFVFGSGALAIKAVASALVKTAAAVHFVVDGVLATKAAADMAALSGSNVATGSKNVYVFTVQADGTLASHAGAAATTLAAIVWPEIPDGQAVIGYIIVENATGANFVPGTTALDTASLTVTYVNTPYPFLPNLQNLS